MTNLRQVATLALEALESGLAFDAHSTVLQNLREALEQPKQEPVISAWSLREVYFDEDGEPSMHRSPPAAPEQVDCPRCGHVCSQRPWVGLTDEDVNRESAMIASKMKLAFHAGMYVAQKILQERNT